MKKTITLLCCICIAAINSINAQVTTVATGLRAPAGISHSPNGMLFVTESGFGSNDGRVTLIMPGGNMRTVIYGLPSYFDTTTHETTGAWRSYLKDTTMWVVVGGGPDPDAGTLMRFEIDSSVIAGDSMTIADAAQIIHIQPWVISQGFSESNPFSAVWDEMGNIYVADAGANAILKIDSTETISVLDTFPAIQNTWTPFPPVIDYVPTKLISDGAGGFLMCNLTGFPFLPGISSIVHVDTMGMTTTMHTGLTQAVDMYADSMSQSVFVLQFGLRDTTFAPIMNSASIVQVNMSGGMDTVAMNFGPSAGMVRDSADGFFVTEIMSGTVLHIQNPHTSVSEIKSNVNSLKVFPNPFSENVNLSFSLDQSSDITYSITDQIGNTLFVKEAGKTDKGNHSVNLDLSSVTNKLSSGIYFISVTGNGISQTVSLMKK